ncbi:MAG: hypothetical protein ACR2IR_04030 [Acidimicrobiia bacterium]
MTGASGLDQVVALFLDNHEDAIADHRGLAHRLRQDHAHRLAVRKYADIAEVDRRSAGRTVRRLHRQLFLLDDRMGGVLGPDRIEPAAYALVRRALGVRDDAAIEEAETTYAQIEEIRRQIPISWALKRARGKEPEDENVSALEAGLDRLEQEYAAIWRRWARRLPNDS